MLTWNLRAHSTGLGRQYRFKTLIALGKSLPDELALMNRLAEDNMKSYQVW
jgi:hypothetical protein